MQQHFKLAFWLMVATILIDAVDGYLARLIRIKEVVPNTDGALLDNIVDYFNYALVPAFFLLAAPWLLPAAWEYICPSLIVLAAAYQFTQLDAKTKDHYFKRFPSYWNIVVFYLFFCEMSPGINVAIILFLVVMSFVPVKFIYPSRVDYISRSYALRVLMVLATIVWGVATVGLLWIYPETSHLLVWISMSYIALYSAISFYRTWKPLTL
jgi:phosphatidylcholine synthase